MTHLDFSSVLAHTHTHTHMHTHTHTHAHTHTHTHTHAHTHTHTHTLISIVLICPCFYILDERPVSLSYILQFFSGASKLPAAGFDETPKISFTSQERLPYASTCALTITFPRSIGLISYDEFQEKMDFCILGSFGFGSV